MSSTSTTLHAARPGELRQGWPVVVACFCVAVFAWGFGFYGQAVYLAELQRLHGWPAALITSATTGYYLLGGALLAVVHRIIGRLGSRTVLASAVVILGAGAIGTSHVTAPWQLYVCAIVMACGWAGATSVAIATTLAQWFDVRRGLAISLALNGASASGFIVAPQLVRLSHAMGLANAVTLLVIASLAVVLPVVLVGVRSRRNPLARFRPTEVHDDRPAFHSSMELLRDAGFWSVSLPFGLALVAQVGFIVHQVAFLLPQLGTSRTSAVVAATSFSAMVGRLGLGVVVDRLNQRITSAVSFASQAAGLAIMLVLPDTPVVLVIGCVVFGLSVGNVITLPSLIVQREFAARSFGMVIGLSSTVGYVALAFGPVLLGVARDVTGGYGVALGICIALQLAAAALVLIKRGA
jgi:MFS family permease